MCLPCVRGGGPRSGGRDLRVCEARLQASPRGARKPRSGWRVVKKQSLSRLAPTAPFTQRSLKTLHKLPNNQSFFCLLFFSKKSMVKEKYGDCFSLKRKAGYFFGVLILERGLARTASSSEALLTCVYICVVLSCSCPRISLSASTSTPPS